MGKKIKLKETDINKSPEAKKASMIKIIALIILLLLLIVLVSLLINRAIGGKGSSNSSNVMEAGERMYNKLTTQINKLSKVDDEDHSVSYITSVSELDNNLVVTYVDKTNSFNEVKYLSTKVDEIDSVANLNENKESQFKIHSTNHVEDSLKPADTYKIGGYIDGDLGLMSYISKKDETSYKVTYNYSYIFTSKQVNSAGLTNEVSSNNFLYFALISYIVSI